MSLWSYCRWSTMDKILCVSEIIFTFSDPRQYRVYKKKCSEYKIASKLDNCKITDHQQTPTANIGHQACISVNFVFICSILLAGGSSKCLIFKWLAHKNFKRKITFFGAARKYGMLLLICKKFRENYT